MYFKHTSGLLRIKNPEVDDDGVEYVTCKTSKEFKRMCKKSVRLQIKWLWSNVIKAGRGWRAKQEIKKYHKGLIGLRDMEKYLRGSINYWFPIFYKINVHELVGLPTVLTNSIMEYALDCTNQKISYYHSLKF